MQAAEPQDAHRWLHRLVGEWRYEIEAPEGAEEPGPESTGTESVRSLGGLWVIGEGTGTMPDGSAMKSVITLGYDPQRQRYVGTWVGSVMTHLWVYDGQLDAAGKVLTLDSEGPDMSVEGKTAKYQDVIEWVSDDHRLLRARMLHDDGEWRDLMVAHYRRVG